MSDKKADLMKNKNAIKRHLQDEIITRYYFSKGRLQNQLKEDEEVVEAIRVLSDTEKYNKILNNK